MDFLIHYSTLIIDEICGQALPQIRDSKILEMITPYKDDIIFAENALFFPDLPESISWQIFIMKYALSCTDEYYLVWKSNALPCHNVTVFDFSLNKPYLYRITDEGTNNKYINTINSLLPNISKTVSGSFDTEYMLIRTDIMQSLISDIESNQVIMGSDFVSKIVDLNTNSAPFNVFELYGVYVSVKYPSAYESKKRNCFTEGSRFFRPLTVNTDDLKWLSKDFDTISFSNTHSFTQEYSNLFQNQYYRTKLTPVQVLDAIFNENSVTDYSTDNMFCPTDRLKYLDKSTFKAYEDLGDRLTQTNIDQAFLCYENASFLCDESDIIKQIISKKNALSDTGLVTVKKVALIILSYNSLDFTRHCLESIYSNCNPNSYLLMIFDNGSTDGSQKWLRAWGEEHSEAIVILNDTNLGFAGGNNACCQYLPEGYDVFYLNNDTRVPPNALFWMRMALYSADDIGGVGAVQNYSKGDGLEDVSFDLPEQYVKYGAQHNVYESNPYEEQSKLCGFAMLITREMYERTGGFDEQFNPGFLEDEDLSIQIRTMGKRLILCQNAFIYHAGSQSFRKRNDLDIDGLFITNREKCISKWGFDPTLYSAMSENEYAFTKSLKMKGYDRNSEFSLVHIGCGCGNMLSHIHYLYPNALLAGVEENEFARKYAIKCISVYSSTDDLPISLDKYDIVAKGLG